MERATRLGLFIRLAGPAFHAMPDAMHWSFDASFLDISQNRPKKTPGIVPASPLLAEPKACFSERSDYRKIGKQIFDNGIMIEKDSVHKRRPIMDLRLRIVPDTFPMAVENGVAFRLWLQDIPKQIPRDHLSQSGVIFNEKGFAPWRNRA